MEKISSRKNAETKKKQRVVESFGKRRHRT